jgi:hypothetical protein
MNEQRQQLASNFKTLYKSESVESKGDDPIIPKGGAGYVDKGTGVNFTCAECYFYKEKKCALYGEAVEIKPYGACNYWTEKPGDEVESNWIGTMSKDTTGYVENKEGFTCGRCKHFDGKSSCELVKGTVKSQGCCNLWEK